MLHHSAGDRRKRSNVNIFFDVDGVLIDGWHADSALRKPWDATLETDLGIDREAFQQSFFRGSGDRSLSPMFECVTGRRDLRDALAEVLPKLGYDGGVEHFIRYWFEKDSNTNTAVMGLVKILRRQKGVRLYVATGQEHHRARYLWDELRFSEIFDEIFYSAKLGLPKKDIRFFEAINETLGIGPDDRPLFFDDQPEIAELATRAGWDATVFRSVEDLRQHPRLRTVWHSAP
jgi:putative hydrolase of the HAD superfamily